MRQCPKALTPTRCTGAAGGALTSMRVFQVGHLGDLWSFWGRHIIPMATFTGHCRWNCCTVFRYLEHKRMFKLRLLSRNDQLTYQTNSNNQICWNDSNQWGNSPNVSMWIFNLPGQSWPIHDLRRPYIPTAQPVDLPDRIWRIFPPVPTALSTKGSWFFDREASDSVVQVLWSVFLMTRASNSPDLHQYFGDMPDMLWNWRCKPICITSFSQIYLFWISYIWSLRSTYSQLNMKRVKLCSLMPQHRWSHTHCGCSFMRWRCWWSAVEC